MKKPNYHDMWCPMGRLSLQHSNNKGDIQVVPGGAFNSVLFSSSLNANEGSKPYLSTTCVGEQCPMYRKSLMPWKWGKCALAHDNTGTNVLLGLACTGILGVFFLMLLAYGG